MQHFFRRAQAIQPGDAPRRPQYCRGEKRWQGGESCKKSFHEFACSFSKRSFNFPVFAWLSRHPRHSATRRGMIAGGFRFDSALQLWTRASLRLRGGSNNNTVPPERTHALENAESRRVHASTSKQRALELRRSGTIQRGILSVLTLGRPFCRIPRPPITADTTRCAVILFFDMLLSDVGTSVGRRRTKTIKLYQNGCVCAGHVLVLVCMYVCRHVCVCMRVCMYVRMYECMHAYMHVCFYNVGHRNN